MKLFSANHLSAGYGGRKVIEDISFDIEEGCLLGIIGANGSGKTTLLKSVCGILPHDGICSIAEITLEGLSPRSIARLCSYIPQRSGISIDISVLDVVLMGFNPALKLLEHPTAAMKETAIRILETAGLAGMENENYLHLSEGQKQLCILARTLVSDSRMLLLDEPESALDFRIRYQMLNTIRSWISKDNRCAIVTLHDPILALNSCDRLLLLSDGRVLGILSPKSDSIEDMERALSMIYGSVSLMRCENRSGRKQLVMLKEDEI